LAEWVEVIVPVGAADVDDVAALIALEVPAAAAGTEQRGDEIVFWVSPEDAAGALAQARDAATRWAAGGMAIDPARARVAAAMPEAEWRDAWKRYFKVTRLTRQIVVVPSWETYAAAADDVVIALDPGMAFGTGTHASTQLVLAELQAIADGGLTPARVLDMGCGSGILAIAAAKLWPACSVLAIDNDPLAIAATAENAAQNGCADRIAAALPVVPAETSSGERFPLVLANIQAHVLRALRVELVARTAPGGVLVLSGLLLPQTAALAAEFVAAGMLHDGGRAGTEWGTVVLRAPSE
jgi:ribosomal protein L11 methyltransferase